MPLPRYTSNKDLFAADARQMFINCAYYNEDNSEVRLAKARQGS